MAVDALVRQLERITASLEPESPPPVQLDRPRNPEHGDLSTNVAMVLAGRLKRPPREVAELIIGQLDLAETGLAAAEVAGPGFINFRFAESSLQDRVREILAAGLHYGRSEAGAGRYVQVEFVSA